MADPVLTADGYTVSWFRIFEVLRRRYPRLDCYGRDKGGDVYGMLKALRNDDLINQVARRLNEIDREYHLATKDAFQKLNKADKDRADKERELIESIGKEGKG